MTTKVSPLYINNIMYTGWFPISLYTAAQNTIHLEFNFSLLILNKIFNRCNSCLNGSQGSEFDKINKTNHTKKPWKNSDARRGYPGPAPLVASLVLLLIKVMIETIHADCVQSSLQFLMNIFESFPAGPYDKLCHMDFSRHNMMTFSGTFQPCLFLKSTIVSENNSKYLLHKMILFLSCKSTNHFRFEISTKKKA